MTVGSVPRIWPSHIDRANPQSPAFLGKIVDISEEALVAWDRVDLDYAAFAERAEPMWFYSPMDVCRNVKYRRGREVPYVTVHGDTAAFWVDGRWIVRDHGESSTDLGRRAGFVGSHGAEAP